MKTVKRALPFALLVAACVPASEEAPPAGAAGYETAPSPETQGAIFETSDGWEITVDRLVVQLAVSATPLSRGYGNSEPYLIDAKSPTQIYARALPVGPASVNVSLYARYYNPYPERSNRSSFDNVTVIGVDEQTSARFDAPAPPDPRMGYPAGATMLIVLRARELSTGRLVTLDALLDLVELAPTSQQYPPEDGTFGDSVQIHDDDLAAVPLPLRVEELFPVFEDIAAMDADGDGIVTATELDASEFIHEDLDRRLPAFFGK